jgi:hypothetical protein
MSRKALAAADDLEPMANPQMHLSGFGTTMRNFSPVVTAVAVGL